MKKIIAAVGAFFKKIGRAFKAFPGKFLAAVRKCAAAAVFFFKGLPGAFAAFGIKFARGVKKLALNFAAYVKARALVAWSFIRNPVRFMRERRERLAAAINDVYTPVKHDPDNALEVNCLKKYFPIKKGLLKTTVGFVKAVDGISFNIKRGATMGLVGESGCGKTTVGRTILRLNDKTGGQVLLDGREIFDYPNRELRKLRPKIQIVFQDPYSSLSPRFTVGEIVGEAVREHNIVPGEQYEDYITGVMKECGLEEYHKARYPHEFSGGQRQRVCIARALALKPEFIVLDEPVSALDVSIQAQVINLLKDLQRKHGLTYLFISHDLSVVEHISDTVGVMYLGNMVEYAPTDAIFASPRHPYTKALFSAVPVPEPGLKSRRIVLEGSLPSPANPPKGCKFHTRCPEARDICKTEEPPKVEVEPGHFAVCHFCKAADISSAGAYKGRSGGVTLSDKVAVSANAVSANNNIAAETKKEPAVRAEIHTAAGERPSVGAAGKDAPSTKVKKPDGAKKARNVAGKIAERETAATVDKLGKPAGASFESVNGFWLAPGESPDGKLPVKKAKAVKKKVAPKKPTPKKAEAKVAEIPDNGGGGVNGFWVRP